MRFSSDGSAAGTPNPVVRRGEAARPDERAHAALDGDARTVAVVVAAAARAQRSRRLSGSRAAASPRRRRALTALSCHAPDTHSHPSPSSRQSLGQPVTPSLSAAVCFSSLVTFLHIELVRSVRMTFSFI